MKIEVFQGIQHTQAGEPGPQNWYWHLRAKNGEITSHTESFVSKGNAIRSAKKHVTNIVQECHGQSMRKLVWYKSEENGLLTITWA